MHCSGYKLALQLAFLMQQVILDAAPGWYRKPTFLGGGCLVGLQKSFKFEVLRLRISAGVSL